MDLEEAKRILLESLGENPILAANGDEYAINKDYIQEKDYGWIIPYNSRSYLETGNYLNMLVGGGLAIVRKSDGDVYQFNTIEETEIQLERYERKLALVGQEKQKRKRAEADGLPNRKRWIIIFGIAVASALVFCFIPIMYLKISFNNSGSLFDLNECPPDEPHKFEGMGGLSLPPSYTNLFSDCSTWQDWGARGFFSMSPADLDDFVIRVNRWLGTDVNLVEFSSESKEILREFPPLAAQVKANDIQSGFYGYSDKYDVKEILINTTNPELYTVMINTFGD